MSVTFSSENRTLSIEVNAHMLPDFRGARVLFRGEREGDGGVAMATAEAEPIVDRFIAAWERADVEELVDYFTENAVIQWVPREPLVGAFLGAARNESCGLSERS